MKGIYSHGSAITTLLYKETTDTLLFGFVEGVISSDPKKSVWEAIGEFEEVFSIDSERWNRETARTTYARIKAIVHKQNNTL